MGNVVQPLWAECPACTRMLLVGYPVISVVLTFLVQSSFAYYIYLGFMCTLETVVHRYCIWTMVLGAFFRPFSGGMSFLFTLFEIYMGAQLLPLKEKELGSLAFAFWVFLMNFSVNVVYLAAMFLMSTSQGDRSYWMQPNSGMWPLIFIAISLNCLSRPDESTSFWGVVSIPNKWYPLCLLGFFSLLSQAIMWNAAAAVAIGYAYPHIKLERVLPSRVRASRWENRCLGGGSRSCIGGSWILASDTAGYELESGDRRYATVSDFGRSGQMQLAGRQVQEQAAAPAPAASRFVVFAGSGQRLGDGSGDSQTMRAPLAPAPQSQEVSPENE